MGNASPFGGCIAPAFGQDKAPAKPVPAPRLDAPELQIDQVGPREIERGERSAPDANGQSLEDFVLGEHVVPEGNLSVRAIMKIQKELGRRGYDPGPIDGILGKGTREAIKRYQAARGWPASGQITIRLLVALHGGDGFRGVAKPSVHSLKDELMAIEAAPLVSQVQDELRRRGYDVPVDGRLDRRTVRAIMRYQSYFGLEPTGAPSEDLLAHIRNRTVPIND